MSVAEFLTSVDAGKLVGEFSFGLVCVLTVIQVAPIKINPWSRIWSWIKKAMDKVFTYIGSCANKELIEKVDTLETELASVKATVAGVQEKVTELDAKAEADAMVTTRARILRFGDELLHSVRHSKDHFESVLRDARVYEVYCQTHEKFENGVTEPTIRRIRDVYDSCLKTNDFL